MVKEVTFETIEAAIEYLDGGDVPMKGRMLHDGERVIAASCEVCGKVYRTLDGLKGHMKSHKG